MKRDLQDLLHQAEALGCRVVMTRSGHYKVYVPGGGMVTTPRSPSDWRSLLNTRSDLRKAGLDI
jgi:hypothetical protein